MNDLPEILDYSGKGFKIVLKFGSWRVSYLNWEEKFSKEGMEYIERHNETDEAFMLLEGEATLLTGEEMHAQAMDIHKIYNVKRGMWHNIIVSRDARVLVIENADTTYTNSEKLYFKK